MKHKGIEREDPPWVAEMAPRRIVYSLPGMDTCQVHKNLVYARAGAVELKADVYLPPGMTPDERRPTVVFVHGGYLPSNLLTQPKDWGIFISYGQLMAASGLIGVTFNHRYYGRDYLVTAQNDLWDLVAYIRENARKLGVDEQRIVLWAFSGGGPLLSKAIRATPEYLCGLVAYYALLHLEPSPEDHTAGITAEVLQNLSPLENLRSLENLALPLFIARAGLDRPALNQTIDRFIQEALSRNAPLDICNHPAGRHGFDVLDDDPRSRHIIRRTLDFIQVHIQRNG